MRLMMLSPEYSPHTRLLVRTFREHGHEVVLVTSSSGPVGPDSFDCQTLRLPGIRGVHRLPQVVSRPLVSWIRARHLRSLCQDVRPDVVNVQGLDQRAYYCALARLRPLLLTAWGSDVNYLFMPLPEDRPFRERLSAMLGISSDSSDGCFRRAIDSQKRAVGFTLRRADYVTCDSPEVLARCAELAKRQLPSALIRFGIDFPENGRAGGSAAGLKQQLSIPDHARVLLSARIVQPGMGHELVLEAFARLLADPGIPDTVLVFKHYLALDSLLIRLKARAAELGVAERVYWLPELPASDVYNQYFLADVVINYPQQDAFPQTLFEAAACRRRVVSSDLPAYEDTFQDSFVMLPPGDVNALAAGIRGCLLETEEVARPFIDAAYRTARAIGDRSRNMRQFIDQCQALSRPAVRSCPRLVPVPPGR
jgi:glycosyltransferase involved in cell wall biosynthesis